MENLKTKMPTLFNVLVGEVESYITNAKLKTMVLGISGGIDSTVVAAICSEVSKRNPEIKFIGRSYPIKNKHDEFSSSELVGKAFADDFKVVSLREPYHAMLLNLVTEENEYLKGKWWLEENKLTTSELEEILKNQTKIANGNIMARLRMINLYNLASITGGLVMDTDNLTEHNLGFFTVHGDEGDLNPIASLWKTDVYQLARELVEYYTSTKEMDKVSALNTSIALIPTDGNGVSDSDLDQIGGKCYEEVDKVLKVITGEEVFSSMSDIDTETVSRIADRHMKSAFKRNERPYPIHVDLNNI